MLGLMQQKNLLLSSIIRHAARWHPHGEIVTHIGAGQFHRTDYAAVERRSRRLATVLRRLGVHDGDRVATMAWNGYRHFELYWAVSGMGAVCHTVNPRFAASDIVYVITHARDSVLFADPCFAPLIAEIAPSIAACVTHIVWLAAPVEMPPLTLPPGLESHCYEELMDRSEEDFEWPDFDENTASALCYTSGTTGRPKGVLYSHRSAVLHALAINTADVFAFRAMDRIFMATSMCHATAWGWPYAAAMSGAAIVMPGRWLDGPTVLRTLNDERITFSGGVPTIWLDVLEALRRSGTRIRHLQRLLIAGSACPRVLIEGFAEYGVDVRQGWGMTETSPIVTHHAAVPVTAELDEEAAIRLRLKQGRPVYGADIQIVDAQGQALPHDGVAFGDLLTRGPWVCREYLHCGSEGAAADDGWFATGDVATIDPQGFVQLVDRSKDVIKSGGEWISSIVLESIALSHPDVAEAAVINARHERWQERPLLLIVARSGRTIDTAELLKIYDGAVAKWWRPDAVVVLDKLPHGATGKLNKVALRQEYQNYLIDQVSAPTR